MENGRMDSMSQNDGSQEVQQEDVRGNNKYACCFCDFKRLTMKENGALYTLTVKHSTRVTKFGGHCGKMTGNQRAVPNLKIMFIGLNE